MSLPVRIVRLGGPTFETLRLPMNASTAAMTSSAAAMTRNATAGCRPAATRPYAAEISRMRQHQDQQHPRGAEQRTAGERILDVEPDLGLGQFDLAVDQSGQVATRRGEQRPQRLLVLVAAARGRVSHRRHPP